MQLAMKKERIPVSDLIFENHNETGKITSVKLYGPGRLRAAGPLE